MRTLIYFLTGLVMGICAALLINTSDAREFKLLDLREVRATYIDFFPKGQDPLITQNGLPGEHELGKQLDLDVDADLAKFGYWNSKVHSLTDQYQFREVNLQMEVGVHVSNYIDLFYWHSSAHLLDGEYANGHWPVQDGVGLHLYFFRTDRDRPWIFE